MRHAEGTDATISAHSRTSFARMGRWVMPIAVSLHIICKLFHCSFRGLVYITFSEILPRLYWSKSYLEGAARVLDVLASMLDRCERAGGFQTKLGTQSRDFRKLAGIHWHRAARMSRLLPPATITISRVRAARASFTSTQTPLANPLLTKIASTPESNVSARRPTAGPPETMPPVSRAQAMKVCAALPITFEANDGKTDPRVRFFSRASGYTLFLTDLEAVLSLPVGSPASASAHTLGHSGSSSAPQLKARRPVRALRLKFAGASAHAPFRCGDQLTGKTN